jgi:hypothetical protein
MRTAVVVLGFLGAGILGGVAARIVARDEAPAPLGPDRLAARVESLEAEVARLSAEMRRPPDLPPLAAAPAAPAAEPPPDPPSPFPDGEIEAKVRATVEEIAREQREEKEQQALAATLAAEEKWIAMVREPLALTDSQVEGLRALLARRREGIAVYKGRLLERGTDITPAEREALAQEMKDLGVALDQELRALLSSSQYDALMAYNEARKQGAGR